MVRRSGAAVADPPTDVSETPAEPEAQVSPTPETPAATPAANGETPAETPAEAPAEVIDLTTIKAALDVVLASDTSDLEKVDFSGVITAYGALGRLGKAAATREFDTRSKDLLEKGDFDTARVILLANKATKAAKPKGDSKPRTPADVTTPVVSKLAAFQLAYGALKANLPEGIAEDWEAQVAALFETGQAEVESMRVYLAADPETRGEAPSISDTAALAVKVAFKASRKPYGQRHNVGLHIEQVFADKASGTFMTDAEIADGKSEEYGDDECSTSAVTARLKSVTEQSKPLADGLSVETREGKLGVLKA